MILRSESFATSDGKYAQFAVLKYMVLW